MENFCIKSYTSEVKNKKMNGENIAVIRLNEALNNAVKSLGIENANGIFAGRFLKTKKARLCDGLYFFCRNFLSEIETDTSEKLFVCLMSVKCFTVKITKFRPNVFQTVHHKPRLKGGHIPARLSLKQRPTPKVMPNV